MVSAADYVGSTEYIIKALDAAPAGSAWAVGTELNLVRRLALAHPDKQIMFLDRTVCYCSTMNRIDLPHLVWALEELVAGPGAQPDHGRPGHRAPRAGRPRPDARAALAIGPSSVPRRRTCARRTLCQQCPAFRATKRRCDVPALVTRALCSPGAAVPALPLLARSVRCAPVLEVALTDDVLVVHGGTPLHGQIRVRGAKNLVSKAMVAALLGETPSRLFDVPRIRDVEVVRGLLELHGVKVTDGDEDGELVMDPTNVERASTDEINVHAGSSRIPILFCGPLLHRLGHAFIPDLGGCHIGPRPIDFHIQALREFGAVVDKTPEGMHLTRARTGCTAPSSSCPTRASAPPSRCCSPPCSPRASPSCATRPSSRRSST